MRRCIPAVALLALLLAGIGLRTCRPPAPPSPGPPPLAPTPDVPPLPEAPATPAAAPPPAPPRADRLRPYLDALGRAVLLRDVRRLAELRAAEPELLPGDFPWIEGQLRGELFAAAGAAEILAARRPQAAVAALALILAEAGRSFLKDVMIDVLARIGGDGAAAALIGALKGDAEERIRARCAKALEKFQGPEAYAALVLALADPALDVRRAAAAALGAMRSADLVRVLVEALLRESNYRVQAELYHSVQRALPDRPEIRGELDLLRNRLPKETREELARRRALRLDALLQATWPPGFFAAGAEPLPFDPARGRRIGITVELGPGVSIAEIAQAVFGEPPFDRYREWFYLRNEADFPAETAYDALGRVLESVPRSDLDGSVYLRFRDPSSFAKGVLGYSKGCEAFVQKVSLVHEIGHALGGLGDEYRGGSPPPHANLSPKRDPPWAALIRDGHLPPPFLREEGVWVPAETCHMNNNAVGEVDYCAVCQLALIARIAELSGAPAP